MGWDGCFVSIQSNSPTHVMSQHLHMIMPGWSHHPFEPWSLFVQARLLRTDGVSGRESGERRSLAGGVGLGGRGRWEGEPNRTPPVLCLCPAGGEAGFLLKWASPLCKFGGRPVPDQPEPFGATSRWWWERAAADERKHDGGGGGQGRAGSRPSFHPMFQLFEIEVAHNLSLTPLPPLPSSWSSIISNSEFVH